MELRRLTLSELYFPRKEWRWLRPTLPFAKAAMAPDSFVWAADVGGKLWAWHSRGADLAELSDSTAMNVLILKTDGSELEAHGLYLKTTFTAQPALDCEWVAALQVLESRLGYSAAERGLPTHWSEALEACGLSAHLGALAQRGRFSFLTDDELQLMYDRRWELACMELAETLSAPIRADFVVAARKWNLGANHAKEVLNFVMILFKKMGEKTVRNVLASPHKNAEEFRTSLLRTAQPELSTLSQKRIEMLRALRVPARTSIYGDPSFESDLLKITHTPRKLADFEVFKAWVNDEETAEGMRQLLEIYQ